MNSDNLIGNILSGRYDIIEKIGTGGMASVYKAKDTLLNRYVAIKVLRDALEGEKDIVTNFIREAQSSASLVHNNIVSVFDVGEDDGVNYMVMELVDGRTLKDYIKEKGALPWQEACDYCIQIGQGIMEAHAKNIIHRDIKPQNIIMTKDKSLKVTDFGIARALTSDTTIVGGTAMGSVHYISPEQARGGFTDARSDIYSLGIVLYEMLTGKVPFDGDNAVSIALMHLEKDPVNVKCVNMSVPQDLAYVTMKAIAKEQANRYQTVAQMLEDLHAVLADEPLASRAAKEEEPVKKKKEDFFGYGYDDDIDDVDDDDDYDDYDEDDDDGYDEYDEYDDYDDDDEYDEDDFSDDVRPRKKKKSKKKRKVKDPEPEEETEEEEENSKKKKKKAKTKEQKKANVHATVAALLTVLILIMGAAGVYWFLNTAQDISVPDVKKKTLSEATSTIEQAGLSVAPEVEYSLSDEIPEGSVIDQSPAGGKRIKKGREVSLVVSIGASGGDIKAPDVVKLTFEEAVTKLSEANLKYAVVEDFSDDVKVGCVIRQAPLKGTMLSAGDIVTIHVSQGGTAQAPTEAPAAAKVTVPSLNGDTKEIAEAKLQKAGLTLGSMSYKYSESMADFIISQSPKAGANIDKGSVVNVIISKGQEPSADGGNTSSDKNEEKATEKPSADSKDDDDDEDKEEAPKKDIDTDSGSGKASFTVKIPDAAGDAVMVKIVSDGKEVHNALHYKSEGSVTVELQGEGSAKVQAYIDDLKVSDKVVEFN